MTVERPAADVLRADSFGRPGDVWGQVSVGTEGARGLRMAEKPFSPASWKAFLDGMSKAPGCLVSLDADRFPNALPTFRVTLQVNDDFTGGLSLSVQFGPELLDDPAFQRSTLVFVRGFADEWNVAHGEISYDRGSGGEPQVSPRLCLADSLPARDRRPPRWRRGAAGRRSLRYRRGPLRSGGYWLLASQDWREFGQLATEKMFPVLRPGEPLPDAPDDPPCDVSRRDAAELEG